MSDDPIAAATTEMVLLARARARIEELEREKERMYQRALDAESHAAFGPMDVDERVRLLRNLVDVTEREKKAAEARIEELEGELRELRTTAPGGLPRTDDRRYDLTQRLKRAVRWLRDAEDIARIEMSAYPTADRIRSIYEQVTEDVVNGSTAIPPVLQRLGEAEARSASIRTETVAEIVASLESMAWNGVGTYDGVVQKLKREFPAPVQADTEETA